MYITIKKSSDYNERKTIWLPMEEDKQEEVSNELGIAMTPNSSTMERLNSLNKAPDNFMGMGGGVVCFERLMEYVNPSTIDEVFLLANSMYEFEIFDEHIK